MSFFFPACWDNWTGASWARWKSVILLWQPDSKVPVCLLNLGFFSTDKAEELSWFSFLSSGLSSELPTFPTLLCQAAHLNSVLNKYHNSEARTSLSGPLAYVKGRYHRSDTYRKVEPWTSRQHPILTNLFPTSTWMLTFDLICLVSH